MLVVFSEFRCRFLSFSQLLISSLLHFCYTNLLFILDSDVISYVSSDMSPWIYNTAVLAFEIVACPSHVLLVMMWWYELLALFNTSFHTAYIDVSTLFSTFFFYTVHGNVVVFFIETWGLRWFVSHDVHQILEVTFSSVELLYPAWNFPELVSW